MRVNSNFNKKKVDFRKEGKKKLREKRKLKGTVEKHKSAVKLQQGTRTRKTQRKIAHKLRMNEKEQQKAVLAASEVEMKDAAPKSKQKQPKQAEGMDMQE